VGRRLDVGQGQDQRRQRHVSRREPELEGADRRRFRQHHAGGAPGGGACELLQQGQVPGVDQAAFTKAAEGAKTGCPISSALKIPMTVKASLES
jgi:hypothetical protein